MICILLLLFSLGSVYTSHSNDHFATLASFTTQTHTNYKENNNSYGAHQNYREFLFGLASYQGEIRAVNYV
jgi:hypothetical protein